MTLHRCAFLLSAILTRSLFAQLPLPIGPEIAASDPEVIAAIGDQSAPSVVSDGRDFIVAWKDSRLGGSIRAARVSARGELLDPTGITLSVSEDPGLSAPSAVWNGSEAVVTWRSSSGALFLSRLNFDGAVLSREKRIIAGGVSDAVIAANNRNLLIVYSSGSQTRSRLLTLKGDPAGSDVILPRAGQLQGLAAAGTRFLLAWTESDAKTLALDDSGVPLQITPTTLGNGVTNAAVGTNGSSFVVAFGSGIRFIQELHTAILSQDGPVTASDTKQIEGGQTFSPRVTWNGDHYEMAWVGLQSNTLYRAQIDTAGKVTGLTDVTMLDGPSLIGAATNGLRTLLSLTRREPRTAADTDVYGRFLNDQQDFLVTKSAREQRNPVIATAPHQMLLAWMEMNKDAQSARILAARVNEAGEHLDGAGIVLTDFASPQTGGPAAATDGSSFLVAWVEAGGELHTQRIGADGSLQESSTIANGVGCRFTTPSLVFNGTNYLLTFSSCALGPAAAGAAIRISRVGIPIEPKVTVSEKAGIDPKAVWTGRHFFIAFEDTTAAVDRFANPPRLVGALLTKDHVVLHLFFIVAEARSKRSLALATNGETVFVAWQTPKDPPSDIYAKVLTTFGDVAVEPTADAGMPVAASTADESQPAVAWNRASLSYIVAWQTNDILIRRFAANGAPIDPAPKILSGSPRAESHPVLAAFASVTAAAYVREADELQYGGVGRIFVRLVGAPARVRAVR